MATTKTTPTRTTARKPAAHFSVAQAEKEWEGSLDEIEPFTVELKNGDIVTFTDPRSIGWQKASALSLENPFGMVRELVNDEDYKSFVQEDFPAEVLGQMAKAWREHYGIDQGN